MDLTQTRHIAIAVITVALTFTACDNSLPNNENTAGHCQTDFPAQKAGPNGETVSIISESLLPEAQCQQYDSARWRFAVPFTATNITGDHLARLQIEIDRDTDGRPVYDSGRGPYDQFPIVAVSDSLVTDTLTGILGPPVSTLVRFHISVQILDMNGGVVCRSAPLRCLVPTLP